MKGVDLQRTLRELIPSCDQLVVAVGQKRQLQPLAELFPQLLLIDELTPLPRLTRDGAPANLVRATADQLPLVDGSITGLIAGEVLHRAPDPAALVDSWARSLQPGGWLVLVERLVLSASLITLRRMWRKADYLRPEDQTALLLNAGFCDIRQRWLRSSGQWVITWAQLRPFVREIVPQGAVLGG